MKSILLLLLTATVGFAQKTEGVVTYERKSYWTKIINRLPYLSREEKDRAAQTWKNDDEYKEKMKLVFNEKGSLYTHEDQQGQTDDGRYTWEKDEYYISRNFDKETKSDIIETLGKTYIIEDSLRTPVWKVMNQIKDVNGYICMKAETTDPIRGQKIAAWFSQDIPVPAGPERYFGLPGIIMELDINDGDVILEAVKVEFKPVEKEMVVPKTKGKKISDKAYDAMLSKHIADSIKANRNPYWGMRY
ncbi:MAG: GLPGLI family protein [Cytophagales bacterium]|nr:MAG: GLPGLI family protein [Cytophagales bacterium]